MSYNTKNIITDYIGEEDDKILSAILNTFKYTQVKIFEAGFKGLIGQLDTMKIQKTILDEEEAYNVIYAIEEGLEGFSWQFPYKKFTFIETDCFGGACIYFGFVIQAGEILFEQSYHPSGHIPLLQAIDSNYEEHYFEPFTRDFFIKQGEIKGIIHDFSMAGLFVLLNTDFGNNPDFQLLTAPSEYVLRRKDQVYYLQFIEQANREIKIIGIIYHINNEIIAELTHIIEDSFAGFNYQIEIDWLEKNKRIELRG